MLRPVRILLALAVTAAVLAAAAGCERVGAAQHTPAAAGPVRDVASISRDETTSAVGLLDEASVEPSEAIDASVPPTAEEPTSFPTVSTLPAWAKRFHGIINGIDTHKKVVALTFDDGPTTRTREVVDQLDAAGAHATFFWVGSRITTEAAQYSLAHGEEIANHTWSHPNMRHLSSAEASAQIGLTNARILQVTGAPAIWFRSPFNRLYRKELAQIRAHGLLYANYNVTSIDWMKGMTDAEIVGKVGDTLVPGGVILLHDSPKHNPTYLPAMLKMLKRRGYKVVTMSELTSHGDPVNEKLTLGVRGLGY